MRRPRRNRWRAGLINLAVIVALLAAVSFLPPDTSLSERRRLGTLHVCLPPTAPPLVTETASAPGYDAEILAELAKRLGLRLVVNPSPAIAKDFNPRNWHITRARCVVIAGGITDTEQTRSFLQVIPTGLRTGWAVVAPTGTTLAAKAKVGVLPGSGGLSRIALSSHLREIGVEARMMPSAAALRQALAAGEIAAGVAEYFTAEALAAEAGGLQVRPLDPDSLGAPRLGLGLWKGDLTLKRAIEAQLSAMEQDGSIARIGMRYGLAPRLDHP